MLMSRRKFLLTSAAATSAVLTGCAESPASNAMAPALETANRASRRLIVDTRSIEVGGRAAAVYGLHQPDGTRGLYLGPGERFAVELDNRLSEPTIVHWHGQTPPPDQDGVDQFGVPLLKPGERRAYDFTARPGTYWMHSHHGFQHQKLLAAPLIVRTADEVRADRQEVTIFLEDFLFRDPAEVFAELQKSKAHSMGAMTGHKAGQTPHSMGGMPGVGSVAGSGMSNHMSGMEMDLNDIDFDAYLANDRTLDDPEVIRVEHRGRVRLRIINGASSTNFHIDLGALQGTVAAVDGNAVKPLRGNRFGLAMAQRIDILVDLPSGIGAWPILAVREGERQQTGIILASRGANVGKIPRMATSAVGPVRFDQELQLPALKPLVERPVDSHTVLMLTGSMQPYTWGINHKGWENRDTVRIRSGQRVAITFQNTTMMAHPMHLHGHHFQLVALNGNAFSGPLRDTVHVPAMAKVTLAFDADNAGRWLMHCHNLYHMVSGMITEVAYV